MNKLMILGGVALLGLAGGAMAQGPGHGPRRGAVDVTRAEAIQRTDAAFARLDANHDGRFTREEGRALAQQRRAQMMSRMFERLDADHNGQISREEFAQGRRGPRGPGPMAQGGADGAPPPGGPGMRRWHHRGPGMRMGGRLFGAADFITAEQFRTRALARFDRADANHDGTLTVAERQARRGRIGGEMRRHRRMGPPPGGPGIPPPPEPAQ
jgi:hypothetical protein